jgi:hypothetical protein
LFQPGKPRNSIATLFEVNSNSISLTAGSNKLKALSGFVSAAKNNIFLLTRIGSIGEERKINSDLQRVPIIKN